MSNHAEAQGHGGLGVWPGSEPPLVGRVLWFRGSAWGGALWALEDSTLREPMLNNPHTCINRPHDSEGCCEFSEDSAPKCANFAAASPRTRRRVASRIWRCGASVKPLRDPR